MNKPAKDADAFDGAGISEDIDALFALASNRAIAFRKTIGGRRQAPLRNFAEMQRAFAQPLPESGRDAGAVIQELADLAEPGLSAMTGPRFFAWVIGASHPAGVAADWLTSAWGQNSGNHVASPAAAASEETAAAWLLELLDLPRECSVGFATGATMANFTCLAAARGHVLRQVGWDVEAKGLFGAPPIRILIGDDAHTSVFSALKFLGLGEERVVRVPTDAAGRMQVVAFRDLIRQADGPTIAIAQAGQINTGAFDPWPEIVAASREKNAWVHVDGAFGLWARACPQTRKQTEGCEGADSWATDGHKWLQTPYDCGYAIVRHKEAHQRAMAITASYLPSNLGGERDPTHFVPELSRRARGFATWAIIRALGRKGISEMVARHCRIARRMADTLAREPGIRIVNEVVLNQVAVRFGADLASEQGDELTHRVIDRIQAEGTCFAGGAKWRDQWIMRLSVISWPTTETDADRSTEAILAAWREVKGLKS